MADLITTHVSDAQDRLLEQYKGKVRIEGLIGCFVEQIQDLEQAIFDLVEKRSLSGATGVQLDLIGTIVVQDRLGFSDDLYRALLAAKIGENVSQADPERVREIVKLLTGATLVNIQKNPPAAYSVSINTQIDPSLIDFFYQRIDRVDAAAVRIETLECFDPDSSFAFEGGPIGSGEDGFGDLTDVNVGGQFAEIHVRTQPPFAFEPPPNFENSDEGFGDLNDVLFGGIFVGL
jgi:hypothetical protein